MTSMNSEREKKIDYLIRFGMIFEEFQNEVNKRAGLEARFEDFDEHRKQLYDAPDKELDEGVAITSAFVAKLRTLG